VLKYLRITNDPNITGRDMKFPSTVFGGRLPKLTSLTLHFLHTDLRGFSFPSLTQFTFATATKTSVRDLTSFLERCPLLEFVEIHLTYTQEPPIAPPRKRVRLDALKELRLDQTASTSGLIDHLILPQCIEMALKGQFTGEVLDQSGSPAARIHPSSIDHLPVTRGITKAVAMPNSCVLSGPNGTLRFCCFEGTRGKFDAEFFTSFSPISTLEIRELWVGQNTKSSFGGGPKHWKQTASGVRSAFEVLTKVEELTIVGCETKPIFAMLETATDEGVLLPRLRRLSIYVGCGDLDIPALVRCSKARKEHLQPLGEVTIVFTEAAASALLAEVESLKDFAAEVNYRVGVAPTLAWDDVDCGNV